MVASNGRQKPKGYHPGGAMCQCGITTGKNREKTLALTQKGWNSNSPSSRMVTSGKMAKTLQFTNLIWFISNGHEDIVWLEAVSLPPSLLWTW